MDLTALSRTKLHEPRQNKNHSLKKNEHTGLPVWLPSTPVCAICCYRQSHLTGEEDQKWVEFLRRANTHNFTKLNAALTGT